jgi:hypothetical protein
MARTARLYDLARVLRSKNAGPFELTLDVMFDDEEIYQAVKRSGVVDRELVCQLYRIPLEDVHHLVYFDAARAIKITIKRPVDSGGIGDTDVYGAQQHAPLIEVMIPIGDEL